MMKKKLMIILNRVVTILLLTFMISSTTVISIAESEEFSVRGGVKFGMTPEEVIAIEESNGFYCDKSDDGDILYKSDYDYQLYYQTSVGKLGSLEIMRYEYDFDLKNKLLYQLEYVFRNQNAYPYLLSALSKKYGEPDSAIKNSTNKYLDIGAKSHISHSRWEVPNGEEMIIVIDLWDNDYNVCFLTYQSFIKQKLMEEEETLDFGL